MKCFLRSGAGVAGSDVRLVRGVISAGLRPAPAEAVVPAAGRQLQKQKPAFRVMTGWVRLRGTLQVRPCKLGRRIHAAHAPATGPTPPSTVSCELLEPAADGGCRPWVGTGSDPVAAQRALPPALLLFFANSFGGNFHRARRKLSGGGGSPWTGPLAPWARGMPRAGWAGRPAPVLPCARDSAHEQGAIEHHGGDFACPDQGDPPPPSRYQEGAETTPTPFTPAPAGPSVCGWQTARTPACPPNRSRG